MISLADLRARNVQPVWQEAVAVIQELIQTVSATSSPLARSRAHRPHSERRRRCAAGQPPPPIPCVTRRMMLDVLVDGIATPPELEQFLQRNLTTPPQLDSLAEFSRQLAFFERPGRRADVERLVGRAAAAEQITRADEELKRLMEKANEADDKPKEMLKEQRSVRQLPTAVLAMALLIWRARAGGILVARSCSATGAAGCRRSPQRLERRPIRRALPGTNAPG